ncbi:MAG: ester cyclase [Blastocatellia bacterium]|nr:ester cyclase [Blastocatellia bacterium]
MSIASTREAITKYLNSKHSDVSMMADDVIFTHMATGEEHHGPQAVLQMLNYLYHVAFAADAVIRNTIFADGQAVLEADFVGKHIGEFAGISATNKEVRVPLCVVYDFEKDQIKRGRVYFEMPVLLQQLGVSPE